MDVKFDMDEAGGAINAYNGAIESLKESTSTLRNDYLSLRDTAWRGTAEKSFMFKFNVEVYPMWEKLICQLEHTRDAICTISTEAEQIKSLSDNLM